MLSLFSAISTRAVAVVEAALKASAFLGFEGISSGQTYVSNVAAVQLMRRFEVPTTKNTKIGAPHIV
jgi:hypothetical protein